MAAYSVAEQLIRAHSTAALSGAKGEISLRIDQTLTQDATGTMVYLAWEALGLAKVLTKLSVSYVDHNTLQSSFENADDHAYLQSIAARYGLYFSPAGCGICHQVHLERFARPGQILLGSDSHTPTAGGLGMLAIGAGGLNVALALAGEPFYIPVPAIVLIRLSGRLRPMVSAKDVILELLRRFGVKGGVGKIFEYGGPGVASLSVPERATIANMGAELGLTTSVFPSDERAQEFLRQQGRATHYRRLVAEPGAAYAATVDCDLSAIEPMVARPHSPDNVVSVRACGRLAIDQVAIGSCTNSSYKDLMTVARILKGKRVRRGVSLVVSPGSKQVFEMIASNGALRDIISAGARILESTCGPCIGMGQAPRTGGISLRTFNRNFKGRSGTQDAGVYIVSPETAAVSALAGRLVDPRRHRGRIVITAMPLVRGRENCIIPPSAGRTTAPIVRGPNIKPLPLCEPMPEQCVAPVLLKVGDNISTDDILPGGAQILPLRSNIPAIAAHVFARLDPEFVARAREAGRGIIVGGANYGQGSSREHAAIAPMYLGVRIIIAGSFSRIHRQNLINYGILPVVFEDAGAVHTLAKGHRLALADLRACVRDQERAVLTNETTGALLGVQLMLSVRERSILLAGGLLNLVRGKRARM